MRPQPAQEITLGVTGASGAIYTLHLLRALVAHYQKIHLLFSSAARVVWASEIDIQLPSSPSKIAAELMPLVEAKEGQLAVYAENNWYAPVASGSAAPRQMVICPASMGCVSAIACGASNNLLERAADVVLKERGQLILVPRETPFSTIHLRNLLTLSEAGATVMPAAPGFYHQPNGLDDIARFMVFRLLDHLGIQQDNAPRWGYQSVSDKGD